MSKFHVFTDFETTGLEANSDVLLEGAIAVVDIQKREIVASFESLIHEDNEEYLDAVRRTLYGEDQFANKMHTKSGLWDDWNDESIPHLTRAGWCEKAIEFLYANGVEPGSSPMAGNSIGSLDRPFALRQLKDFSDFLSYRNLDISALRMWILDNAPHIEQAWLDESDVWQVANGMTTKHRALDDVLLSVQQWKFYSEEVFK